MGQKRLDYKWIIAAISFVMIFTVLGFCSSNRGVYTAAITEALAMSRSVYSFAYSFRFVTTAIVNVFFGFMIAKFGTKKLIATGFLSLVLSCYIYSSQTTAFAFSVAAVLLGLGLSLTSTTMVSAIIERWFTEKKGTVMGAVLAANGIGGAVAVQIISPIIYDSSTKFGYQNAYRMIAVLMIVVGVLACVFLKENSDKTENVVLGKSKKKQRGTSWEGIPFSIALRKWYFYVAIVSIFVAGFVLQGIGEIAAPLYRDAGLSDSYIATLLSVASLSLTVCKFGIGVVYDNLGFRTSVNICYISSIVVMFLLTLASNTMTGRILAMFRSVFSALALPLETIMLPIFASELFGERSFDKALGIIAAAKSVGIAISGPLFNLCYDWLGNYNLAIYMSCILMIAATVMMQFVIKAAKKDREAIMLNQG